MSDTIRHTAPEPNDIRDVLAHLLHGGVLSEALAERIFELILTGQVNDAQLGAMLGLITSRGASVEEIVAGVRVLRRHMVPVHAQRAALAVRAAGTDPVVFDTCGTGGGPKVFNVSTIAAFVVAAALPGRVLVAKHGGRSRTGRGSAEVLERLGVNISASPTAQEACLADCGICFSFAPAHHPAMRHAAGARKSLGFPTIFNLIGPLSNPSGATHQLVGTFNRGVATRLAEALARLGTRRALVVTSEDGLDELTTTALNHVIEVVTTDDAAGWTLRETTLDAAELGYPRRRIDELQVGSLDEAAALMMNVLRGRSGAARDMVELNAGAAIWLAGGADDLRSATQAASAAIQCGAALNVFERMRAGSLPSAAVQE